MKWQLAGDWPVGQFVVPAGTMLEGESPIWNGIKLPVPLPLNVTALDEEAALQICSWYREELWHQLHFARGINREAIIAQGLHNKRWPNAPVPKAASGKRK